MADGVEFRNINEVIRKTYDMLIHIRNSQLKYLKDLKHRKHEYGFIVTPDLILQYNHVHQLMRSFRTGMPADICVEDGGITCSNLSVLNAEQVAGERIDSFPTRLPVTDDSDYLASRIIDLLDRSVSAGDQDLTLSVRDEFAANIRTLNLLFEERYRLCQEQGERLKNELSTTKRRLAASRTAASEAAANSAAEKTIQQMREQIARYEAQLLVARTQFERLRVLNENSLRHNQHEVEQLAQRIDHMAGRRDDRGGDLLELLRKLVDSLESERNRVTSVVKQITLADNRHPAPPSVEDVQSRGAESASASQPQQRQEVRIETDTRNRADQDLQKYKHTLDKIFQIKQSVLDVVPLLPQYEFPGNASTDYETMNRLYSYISYILDKMRDVYKFLLTQSGYLYSIGITAYREYVPIESMTRKRTDTFTTQLEQILSENSNQLSVQKGRVIDLLERILGELPQLKTDFENFYKSKIFYDANEQSIRQKDETIESLKRDLQKCRSNTLSSRELSEYAALLGENRLNRTTIRGLQSALDALVRDEYGSSKKKNPYDPVVRYTVASADLKREVSLRSALLIEFRRLYNKLAVYVQQLGDEYGKWLDDVGMKNKRSLTLMKNHDTRITEMFNEADRVINYSHTPRSTELQNTIAEIQNPLPASSQTSRSSVLSTYQRRDKDRWTDTQSSSGVETYGTGNSLDD